MTGGVVQRNVSVEMYLPSLAQLRLDSTELPPGFVLRRYRAGSAEDRAACTAIWQDAERRLWGNPSLTLPDTWFQKGFGEDDAVIADRQYYVVDPEGELIATTTAWFDGDDPRRATTGMVHYVGMKSDYAGQGLSKPLMSQVLLRMRELGHTDCILHTSTGRVVIARSTALASTFSQDKGNSMA
jgi:GNAT superfamily N-acetyltransferase